MIHFIYGLDSYRVRKEASDIADIISNKIKPESILKLDASIELDYNAFVSSIKTVGLFSNNNLIVISNVFGISDFGANLKEYGVLSDKERQIILFECKGVAELKKIDKKLFEYLSEKPSISKKIELLDDFKISEWAIDEAKNRGLKLSSSTSRYLTGLLTDIDKNKKFSDTERSWFIASELDKISSYLSNTEDKNVTKEIIDILVVPRKNMNVFLLTDEIAGSNRAKAVSILYYFMESGMDPYYIHSMLMYQFRNMLIVKSLMLESASQPTIIAKTKLHPYVVKKTCSQVSSYDIEFLKNRFKKLHKMEIDTKNGNSDLQDELYNFIFS